MTKNTSRKMSVLPKHTLTKKSARISIGAARSEATDLLTGPYNPDLFSLDIETHFIKIAFFMVGIFVDGLDHVDFYSDRREGQGGFQEASNSSVFSSTSGVKPR